MRKRGKLGRLIAIGAAAFTALGLSAVAADATDNVQAAVTLHVAYINVGTAGSADPLFAVIKKFEAKYPGVNVEATGYPNDIYQQVVPAQLASGQAPDVMVVHAGYGSPMSVNVLASEGLLVDQSNQPWAKTVPAALRSASGIRGKLYTYPEGFSFIGVFFNKDYFAAHHLTIPQTFNQLLSDCKAIRAAGVDTPMTLGAQTAVYTLFPGYALQASTVYASDPTFAQRRLANKTSFAASAGWQKSFQQYAEMNKQGCFGPSPTAISGNASMAAFENGRSPMFTGVVEFLPIFRSANPNLNIGMFAFPGNVKKSLTRVPAGVSSGFAVPKNSPHKDWAEKWMAFTAQKSIADPYAKGHGEVPASVFTANRKGGKLPLPQGTDYMVYYFRHGLAVTYLDQLWPSSAVQLTYTSDVQGLLSGQKSPLDILKDMDAAWSSKK